jgi:hypothetical protein
MGFYQSLILGSIFLFFPGNNRAQVASIGSNLNQGLNLNDSIIVTHGAHTIGDTSGGLKVRGQTITLQSDQTLLGLSPNTTVNPTSLGLGLTTVPRNTSLDYLLRGRNSEPDYALCRRSYLDASSGCYDLSTTINVYPIQINEIANAPDESDFNQDTADKKEFVCPAEGGMGSLSHIFEALDEGSCFEKRLSYTRSGNDKSKQQELLQSDQSACSCLRNHVNQSVREFMEGKDSSELKKSVAKNELHSILDGILLHSFHVLGGGGYRQYSSNFYKKDSIHYDLNQDLLKDQAPYPAGQCLSPRAFLILNSRPKESVQKALEEPEFVAKNWNYRDLISRYDFFMNMPVQERNKSAEEIQELKEKLIFLNRNPLVKYALGAPDVDDQTKKNIYATIQLLRNDDCDQLGSSCSNKFNKDLGGILGSEKVLKSVRAEAEADHKDRSERKSKKSSPVEPWGNVTQEKLVEQFRANFGWNKSPDECESGLTDQKDKQECLEIFKSYCKVVDTYGPYIGKVGQSSKVSVDERVVDNLEELIANDVNPDFKTNKEFKNLNEELCGERKARIATQKTKNFDDFKNEYCKDEDKSVSPCDLKSSASYARLFHLWKQSYPYTPNSAVRFDTKAINGRRYSDWENSYTRIAEEVSSIPEASSRDILDAKVYVRKPVDKLTLRSDFNLAQKNAAMKAQQRGIDPSVLADRPGDKSDSNYIQSSSNTESTRATYNPQASFAEPFSEMTQNFFQPSTGTISQNNVLQPNPQKVEEMNEERKQELLEDWQKDYDSWKKGKEGTEMSAADLARDSALRQEIATLKALLDQQRELSQQQYKLLNDAFAAKNNPSQEASNVSAPESKRGQSQFASASGPSAAEEVTDSSRSPASARETRLNSAGVGGGTEGRSAVGARRSSTSSETSSDSAVAREEAKLVNMRRYSDGSITIESIGSTNSVGANAITVPVSDEQYRLLQSNPTSLNLSQIERSIPKDQIMTLERRGEITLLLQNGSNPPFEVKVQKKDNKLVYSLKDQNGNKQQPIRRVSTLRALTDNLRTQ